MSETLSIALVAEGATDTIVIECALTSILGDRPFVLNRIPPETSLAFKEFGGGWGGVYKTCHDLPDLGQGKLSVDSLLFLRHHLLIIHLDADVAWADYADISITPLESDGPLPCALTCPPVVDTTNALRKVLETWVGSIPSNTVVCMPSKSTEAWVLAMLFPNDEALNGEIECRRNPDERFRGHEYKSARFRKSIRDYTRGSEEMTSTWARIAGPNGLSEANRFQMEFLAAVAQVVV